MTENKTDYIEIDWADVRVGDALMHENGDLLTVTLMVFDNEPGQLPDGGVWRMAGRLEGLGFTPHRKATLQDKIARAIHDGPGAQAQYVKAGIAPHGFEDCEYSEQYFNDADAVLAVLDLDLDPIRTEARVVTVEQIEQAIMGRTATAGAEAVQRLYREGNETKED